MQACIVAIIIVGKLVHGVHKKSLIQLYSRNKVNNVRHSSVIQYTQSKGDDDTRHKQAIYKSMPA